MLKIALIGYGYWGKNLARNFNNLPTCNFFALAEVDENKRASFAAAYPKAKVFSDAKEVLADSEIDAVVIATPVDSHYSLAKAALEAGKNVLVEKPMTDSHVKAMELQKIAEEKGLVLMVDHTFLYTGAVRYLKEKVDAGDYGNITYVDSMRINLGLFQHDVNVLWDLAPHDISIVHYLVNKRPISLTAIGISHTNNNIENIAYLTLKYEGNLMVHFNCSWVSPVKLRQMIIGGDKKMILFNDMEPTEKLKVYDTGFKVRSDQEKNIFNADYRVGDIYVPKVPATEALLLMAEDFVNSINNGNSPDSNAALGVHVVEILEKAELSIKNNGKEILLD